MKLINGNILNQNGIILHQVNCKGVFGAGLAKQIANRFPQVKSEYLEFCKSESNLFGSLQFVQISDDVVFANSFSQNSYGRTGKHTNETYLINNIKRAYKASQESGLHLYIPYNVGCGLGGGDWDTIYNGIKHLDITIVKFQ